MRISPVYNHSLLNEIFKLDNCTISELKKHYLPPEQPGVIQGVAVYFESDLELLASMGCISLDHDRVKFINWP